MKSLIFLLFLFVIFQVKAQNNPSNPTIPKVTLGSPGAAQFEKYGDYPVDYSTGIPQINIPIYNIESSRLKLPISLSYHSAGFKPSEASGSVAFGWTLNTGGRISRVVLNKPDEFAQTTYPFRSSSSININTINDQAYIAELYDQTNITSHDGEYDIFYYSTFDKTGRFVLKNVGSLQRVPVTIPFRPIKITSNSNLSYNSPIDYFEIVDEDGNTFRFGKSYLNDDNKEITYPDRNAPFSFPTSWLLSEIISPDKTDTIHLKYRAALAFTGYSHRIDKYAVPFNGGIINTGSCEVQGFDCSSSATIPDNSHIPSTQQYECQIAEIDFKFGKVLFDYKSAPFSYVTTGLTLDKVRVLNRSGQLLKCVQFNQSYFGFNSSYQSNYFKLDSLNFQDSNFKTVNSYKFGYNSSNVDVPQNYAQNTGIDFWGFYNGQISNANLLPAWTGTLWPTGQVVTVGSANRQSNETAMKTYMLNTITYPTGGSSQFIYEGNRIGGTNPIFGGPVVGGLRIQQRINASLNGINEYRTYKYGNSPDSESGIGDLRLDPEQGFYTTIIHILNMCTSCPNSAPPAGKSDQYIYNSDFMDGSTVFESSSVFYPSVAEYFGNDAGNIGKTVYYFSEPDNGYINSQFFHYINQIQTWKGGELLTKKNYSNVSGTYNLVERDDFTFQPRLIDSLPGMKVMCNTMMNIDAMPYQFFSYAQYFGLTNDKVFNYFDYYITTGVNQLTQKVHTEYYPTGNIVTTNNYSYNTLHNFPISSSTTDSKGRLILQQDYYPTDLSLAGYQEDARQKLVSHNMLSPVLQSKLTKNSVQDFLTVNNYKDFGSGIPTRESVDLQVGSNLVEKRVLFVNYDNQLNLIEDRKVNAPSVSYLYGKVSPGPVAEVLNSHSKDIFYDGFEDGDGNSPNWDSKTGHYSYNGTAVPYSNALTGLDAGTYTLTYWLKSGTAWTLQNQQVTVSGSSYTININGQIDDIRFYPSEAQMTTYTFDPIVGMTSTTDAKGMPTYYDYDSYQRLMNVRNKDRNVVKSYCYDYAGRVSNCYINLPSYSNVQKDTSFVRACGTGYTGSSVPYTVPSGTYTSNISQADADNQARADALINGPIRATALGTCTINTSFSLTNSTGAGYQINFTGPFNMTYDFPNNGSLTVQVPVGVYSVSIYPTGAYNNHTIALTGQTSVIAPRTTFGNVSVNTGTLLTASLY